MIDFACMLKRTGFVLDAAFTSDAPITGLVGPSGSGKSTIINLIAGLVRPTRGHIIAGGTPLTRTASGLQIPPHKRGVGLVFQDAHLFPHLSVRRNLSYARDFGRSREDGIRFDAVVAVLGLAHLLARPPGTLSGGERQRVAIGRALLAAPRLLLMDEPLASLDTARKIEILPFIERLRDEFKIPVLYVSHSLDEVARLASYVVRVERGTVTDAGAAASILAPGTLAAASDRFAVISAITGTLERYNSNFDVSTVAHPAGSIVVPGRPAVAPGTAVRITLRATDIALSPSPPDAVSIRTALRARISRIDPAGPFALVTLMLDGGDRIVSCITRLAAADLGLIPGAPVYALVKSVAIEEVGISVEPRA